MLPSLRLTAVLLSLPLVASFAIAQSEDLAGKHPIDAAMEKAMNQDPSTGGQTEAIDEALREWDKELNQNFGELMAGLDPAGRERLRASQRAWLAWRDAEIQMLESLYGQLEGTMWVPMHATAVMSLTRDRALRLQGLGSLISENRAESELNVEPIELEVRGAKLKIDGQSDRDSLRKAFQVFAPDSSPGLDTKDRLQYDLPLVAGQASAVFMFDFEASGNLRNILIDGYMKKQVPTVTKLISWLNENAGKPTKGEGGALIWNHGGWSFTHYHGGDGEDSTYSMHIKPN